MNKIIVTPAGRKKYLTHPKNNQNLWGSLKGARYGASKSEIAISNNSFNFNKMNQYLQILKSRNFTTINKL